MLVRLGSLQDGLHACLHCGEVFFATGHKLHCSTRCRRDYQNERRKREYRAAIANGIGQTIYFCPVCGVPKRGVLHEEETGRPCSRCCRDYLRVLKDNGLRFVEHKPNYILAAALFPQRDPWQADNLTDEERETLMYNQPQETEQAILEDVDMIEYYKGRIEAAYSTGFEQWVQKLMEEPVPAEQEEAAEE